jgi:hypothetical protein
MNSHIDYIENTHDFDSSKLTDEEVNQWGSVLFDTDKTLDEKKVALGILAHVGNITAYQHLQKYNEQPDKGLEEWATLAFGECTLFLHGDLCGDDDNDDDWVFTGVGKHNNQMRFYFMVLPPEGKLLEPWQHEIIEKEMTYTAEDLKCETIEWFDFKPHYVGFSILMPVTISVSQYIDKAIAQCNVFGGFLIEEYYCGTGIPDEKEIAEIIDIVMNGEPEE